MSLFNITDFSKIVFHDIFSCGEVTTFCSFNDYYPNKVIFDMYTYQGTLLYKPRKPSVGYINAEFRDNHIYIIDCRLIIENKGNGKKISLLMFLYIPQGFCKSETSSIAIKLPPLFANTILRSIVLLNAFL